MNLAFKCRILGAGDALARLQKARKATANARSELDKFLRFVKDPDLERKLGLLNHNLEYYFRVAASDNDTVYFQKVAEESSLSDLMLDMKEVVKDVAIEDVLQPFSNHEGMSAGLMCILELGRAASTPDVGVTPEMGTIMTVLRLFYDCFTADLGADCDAQEHRRQSRALRRRLPPRHTTLLHQWPHRHRHRHPWLKRCLRSCVSCVIWASIQPRHSGRSLLTITTL